MNLGDPLAKRFYKNKKVLTLLVIVALAAVGGAVYIKTSQKKITGTDTTTKSTTAPKQYAATAGGGGTTASSTAAGSGSAAAATPSATAGASASSLPAPSGQLLNKQTVSLSSTTPQTSPDLESICQTVANASCDIDLTSASGQVKDVGALNTGSDGSVIFDWNAKTLGLTTGKWTVQAVAVQGNQSATSHSEYLEVQP
jgi:hypothetical protein